MTPLRDARRPRPRPAAPCVRSRSTQHSRTHVQTGAVMSAPRVPASEHSRRMFRRSFAEHSVGTFRRNIPSEHAVEHWCSNSLFSILRSNLRSNDRWLASLGHGVYSYGLCSYGLASLGHGVYSYGLCSYGLASLGHGVVRTNGKHSRAPRTMAITHMASADVGSLDLEAQDSQSHERSLQQNESRRVQGGVG